MDIQSFNIEHQNRQSLNEKEFKWAKLLRQKVEIDIFLKSTDLENIVKDELVQNENIFSNCLFLRLCSYLNKLEQIC
jgi:hypothetical protein